MDAPDKENASKTTKIPVSQAPLRPLRRHLTNKLKSVREPLTTIPEPNSPNVLYQRNPGKTGIPNTDLKDKVYPFKMDTKTVTVTRGCEDFAIYTDGRKECDQSIITISSDEDENIRKDETYVVVPSPGYSHMESMMGWEYSADILEYLLETETKLAAPPRVRSDNRASIINWIMKINGVEGSPRTIQTAVRLLDTTLTTVNVSAENIQLLAAATYWIATKVQGPSTSASELVEHANNTFGTLRLLVAERIIMKKLKFTLPSVVAQDFIDYFVWFCGRDGSDDIEVAATFLCLCGTMVDKSLCQEYPSVLAAASLRNALLLLRKNELMPKLQSCFVFVAAERKTSNISHTCANLRDAVRTVASNGYEHKFILERFGTVPECITHKIVYAANELAILDNNTSALIF